MENDFNNALNSWIDAVQTTVIDPQVNKDHIDKAQDYKLKTESGQKFVRVVNGDNLNHRSAWAFVAMADGESKGLGKYNKGDIFKSAGWKVPAKHARGNIFDLSNGPTCNVSQWTGPNYLKGGIYA